MDLMEIKLVPDPIRAGHHELFIDGRNVSRFVKSYHVDVNASEPYAKVTIEFWANVEIEPIEFLAEVEDGTKTD